MTKLCWLHGTVARIISLLLAIALSALILLYPHPLISEQGGTSHSLLMLLLAGICIGFIHGVGFSPGTIAWRELLGPIICWPVMLAGLLIMLL